MPNAQLVPDQLAIRETIETYLNRLDARDWGAVAACFAPDARSQYNFEPDVLVGGDAVVAWLRARLDHYLATQHALANLHIGMEGGLARCDSRVTASLLHEVDGERRIAVRAIRYSDTLRREDGTWRIVQRLHEPQWQYEVAAKVPGL